MHLRSCNSLALSVLTTLQLFILLHILSAGVVKIVLHKVSKKTALPKYYFSVCLCVDGYFYSKSKGLDLCLLAQN